jgi:hypothetical protein
LPGTWQEFSEPGGLTKRRRPDIGDIGPRSWEAVLSGSTARSSTSILSGTPARSAAAVLFRFAARPSFSRPPAPTSTDKTTGARMVDRPPRRGLRRRLSPEVFAAFDAGDEYTLRRALGLPPWHASPLRDNLEGPAPYGSEEMLINQTGPAALKIRHEILAAMTGGAALTCSR